MRSYYNLKPNFDFSILIHEVNENPSPAHNKNKKVEMTLAFSFFILRRLIGQISI